MILSEVIIENFLSIKEATISFPKSGLILISGWNEMTNRANAAGKTAIMQAICWCLYNELPRDIKVNELIRRGQNSCSVTVKASFNGEEWIITRKRPSDFTIISGGKKQKGNLKFLQSLLEQEIGFDYKQFLVTSYSPQKGDSTRFLNQKDSSAKDFLGVILRLSKAEHAYKRLHMQIKDCELELSNLHVKSATLKQSLDKLNAISKLSIPDLPNKDEVLSVKNELQLVQQIIDNPPDTSNVDNKILIAKNKMSEVNQAKYDTSNIASSIDKLKMQISNIEDETDVYRMSCPSCGEGLIEVINEDRTVLKVFDEESQREAVNAKISAIKIRIAEYEQNMNHCKQIAQKFDVVSEVLEKLNKSKEDLRVNYLLAEQKKKTLEIQMRGFKESFELHHKIKEQVNTVSTQIDEIQSRLSEITLSIDKLDDELMLKSAAKQIMSPTGAIAYSLDSVIEDINSEVVYYLDMFSHGTMTYRMSSGEDKANIMHHITLDGDDVSLGSLSGGEERGLILSIDLGLSEVLSKRCGVPLPSILMLDECFDGLDYAGKERVIDTLKEIAKSRCIIVIDHSTEMGSLFDRMIKVTKKNGISEVTIES